MLDWRVCAGQNDPEQRCKISVAVATPIAFRLGSAEPKQQFNTPVEECGVVCNRFDYTSKRFALRKRCWRHAFQQPHNRPRINGGNILEHFHFYSIEASYVRQYSAIRQPLINDPNSDQFLTQISYAPLKSSTHPC